LTVKTKPSIESGVPLTLPEALPDKKGYLKIRLTYNTPIPTHSRSFQLKEDYGIEPPYPEDICILLPCRKVFPELEKFLPFFNRLKEIGVISSQAKLKDFTILDEDVSTLAYLL
jgi:hypothetical protein